MGRVAVPPELMVWLETLLPPLLLKVTVYVVGLTVFHFAYNVILEVTTVEKLYTVVSPELLYQLSKV